MPEKTNILFIQSQEGFGADSAVHAQLMRYLDPEHHVVHVACTKGDGAERPASLVQLQQIPDLRVLPTQFVPGVRERSARRVVTSAPQALLAPIEVLRLRRYIREHRIRIVHSSERPRDSLYAVGLARLTGAKSVVHVHVKWSEHYSAPARWAVNAADAVFSISKFVTGTLVAMRRPLGSVYTILNCIDPSAWDPDTQGNHLRSELGIPLDAPLLASVSRLFVWKGQRELLRAFKIVRERIPGAYLLIVGGDAPHEGTSFTAQLKELAASLGVADAVKFTGARNDIQRVMAACDVFTLPSFEEPFGLVFLEAMVMRRPVAAIDNGGTPEVLQHGEHGLLSAPWDVPALAANIVQLLENPELRARMGEQGRQRVLEHFTPERMAREAAAAYQRILSAEH